MSKYIKLDDVIENRTYCVIPMCSECRFYDEMRDKCDVKELLESLPTIEVSEDCDNCVWNTCNYNKVPWEVSEDAIRCYGFLKERIGSEITDNAEEFEKWFERMAWHVQKCNEYDTEMRNVSEDAISREWVIKRWDEMSVRGRTEFDQEIMVAPSVIPKAKEGEMNLPTEIHDRCVMGSIAHSLAVIADAFTRIADTLERLADSKDEPQTENIKVTCDMVGSKKEIEYQLPKCEMSKYIDADDAMQRIKQVYEDMGVDTHGVWNKQLAEIFKTADVEDVRMCLHKILGAVSQAPSIDIVRCKECKHNYGKMKPRCDFTDRMLTESDFCSRGEREGE